MLYFIKKSRKLIILSLLPLIILAALGYFSLSLNAQAPIDPKALAEADAKRYEQERAKTLYNSSDIEEMAYANDKSGCGQKAAVFFIMSRNYLSGKPAEDVAGSGGKILLPLVETVYSKIEKHGIEKATLNNMKEYQSCVEKAKPHKDAGREYDMSLKHDACVEFNKAILDVLSAIKGRKDAEKLLRRYEEKEVDFSATIYKNIPNPILLFATKIYKVSKNSEYKNVVLAGSNFSAACYM